MKLFAISLLLFSVCLFGGCINEDTDSCAEIVKNNLTLIFEHTDSKGADIFHDNIHKVDVFVFGTNGSFVKRQSVDEKALSTFAGTELSLKAGTYRLICLGNIYAKTSLSGFDKDSLFSKAFINFGILNEHNITKGADPLYYAPKLSAQSFKVTVPEQGTQTATIPFRSIHIKIEVYVKGLEDYSFIGESLPPLIELNNIQSGFDFSLQPSKTLISYQNISEYKTIEGQQMATLDFYTPLFGASTSAQLLIKKQSDNTTLTTINLKDFIKEHNINITGFTEAVIPILVEYHSSTAVSIDIPAWKEIPVTPGGLN
jgi:hypothetical protein